MSKQSEAKIKQGFQKKCPCCGNCTQFTFEKEKVSWGAYYKNVNLRCSTGNFKVGKSNWCTEHKFKEDE